MTTPRVTEILPANSTHGDHTDITEPRHVAVVELPGSVELTAEDCAVRAQDAREQLATWQHNPRMVRHLQAEIDAWDRLAAERTAADIERLDEIGHEDEARARYGDPAVDQYFAAQGLDVHAHRCDCAHPLTCDLRDQSNLA